MCNKIRGKQTLSYECEYLTVQWQKKDITRGKTTNGIYGPFKCDNNDICIKV